MNTMVSGAIQTVLKIRCQPRAWTVSDWHTVLMRRNHLNGLICLKCFHLQATFRLWGDCWYYPFEWLNFNTTSATIYKKKERKKEMEAEGYHFVPFLPIKGSWKKTKATAIRHEIEMVMTQKTLTVLVGILQSMATVCVWVSTPIQRQGQTQLYEAPPPPRKRQNTDLYIFTPLPPQRLPWSLA